MKFTINTKTFSSVLTRLSRVLASKNTLLILDNFLIELSGGAICVTASDVENTASVIVKVIDADGDDSFCVNASRMVALIKALADQPVTLELNGAEIKLATAQGSYSLPCVGGENYPKAASVESVDRFNIDSSAMAHALSKVSWACGNDELRPQFKGVLFDLAPGKLTLCATDTHKLSKYETEANGGNESRVIVPFKTSRLIPILFSDDETETEVIVGEKSIIFRSEGVSLTSLLIKGAFPDYRRVIPQAEPQWLAVDRQTLISSLGRVSTFAADATHLVRLTLSHGAGLMSISANDAHMQSVATENLPCDYAGGDLVVGFNADYLAQVLTALPGDEAGIGLYDASRPAKFAATDSYGEIEAVLIPMCVSEV